MLIWITLKYFSASFNIFYVNCKHMVKLDQINISNEGLTKFFSPIESAIMKTLWNEGEMMTSELTEKTKIPLTSVAGTLDRLVKAGYAMRRVETVNGRVRYVYAPVSSEEEAATEITTRVLDSLVDAFGPLALENFSKYSGKK
ncbi:MAG: MarR family transcriptional regulator [Candidatus Methanoperedens sp.]|nr:MarR family transcriptional regulator [Candidatus Methanoperedens sp.]